MMQQESIAGTPRKYKSSYKLWSLLLVWVSSLLFLLFQGGKMAYMVFIIMTVLAIYLMLGRYSGIVRAKGTRSLLNIPPNGEVASGTPLEVEVSIQVPGLWPIPYVIMKDTLTRKYQPPQSYEFSLILDWRRKGKVVYQTKPLRRGVYTFEQLTCSTEDIFGFFNHEGTISISQSFIVIPKTVPIRQWHYFEQIQRGFYHQSPSTRRLRETTQINGVRDYAYGDKLTRIHWNATARTGDWKSKEFERESLPKTIYVLDRNSQAYPNEDAFELAVSTVASLLKFGRNKGVPQGLLSKGQERAYFEAAMGHSHMVRMLRHLTEVEADGNASIDRLLKEHCARTDKGWFFVVVTSEHGESMERLRQWLHNSGHQFCHLWISPKATYNEQFHYLKAVTSQGYGYPVPSLTELPSVLEGRYG